MCLSLFSSFSTHPSLLSCRPLDAVNGSYNPFRSFLPFKHLLSTEVNPEVFPTVPYLTVTSSRRSRRMSKPKAMKIRNSFPSGSLKTPRAPYSTMLRRAWRIPDRLHTSSSSRTSSLPVNLRRLPPVKALKYLLLKNKFCPPRLLGPPVTINLYDLSVSLVPFKC